MREHIGTQYGKDYLPAEPNVYKTKKDAQDAHEAIRPTSMQYDPESVRAQLTPDQYYLYRLIWNRFILSRGWGLGPACGWHRATIAWDDRRFEPSSVRRS